MSLQEHAIILASIYLCVWGSLATAILCLCFEVSTHLVKRLKRTLYDHRSNNHNRVGMVYRLHNRIGSKKLPGKTETKP